MRHARWVAHISGVHADPVMRGWLVDTMSLTQKLIGHSSSFRVRRSRQCRAQCLPDEARAVCLPPRRMVQEREVLLECDGQPMVYAHTIVPLSATTSDWPFFGSLGERSLGTTLFGDPRVKRGQLHYARLRREHPLAERASRALGTTLALDAPLFARRCLYQRRNGLLLVTELFLPAISRLVPRAQLAPAD